MIPIRRAFCSPVLASAAGVPVAASVSAMSVRCAPALVVPAAASRGRLAARLSRSQSSTASAGASARRAAIGQTRLTRAIGKPGKAGSGVQPSDQRDARGGGGDGVARHGVFQAGEPGRILAAFAKQAVALGHGGVMRRDLAGVAGFQRPDQPVEEAAAPGQALLEQPIHLWGQPDSGDAGGDLGLAARRGAVEPKHSAVRRSFGRCAGADVHLAFSSGEAAGDRPATGPPMPREIGGSGTTQTAARHQQRDRLQQIGLAAAIGSKQYGNAGRRTPGERRVITEVGQRQA